MSVIELNKRDGSVAKSAKKCRKRGKIPGILYGKNINNFMFEIGEMDLVDEITANGQYGVMNVNYNGKEHKALIKEMQRDPATNKIIHLDLEEVSAGEKVISTVPIHYIGEEHINKKGIVLQKEKDSVKVEGNVDSLPKYLNINIGTGTVGDVYKFGDLEIGSEISIVDDLNSVIASVIYERKRVADDMEMAVEENES